MIIIIIIITITIDNERRPWAPGRSQWSPALPEWLFTIILAYVHRHLYIYIYIYIYIHTHTRTYTLPREEGNGAERRGEAKGSMVAIFYPFSQFCEINIALLSQQTQPNTAPNLFQRGVDYGKYD